jgi:hypothetical protein
MGNLFDSIGEIAGMWICDNCDTLASVNYGVGEIIVNQCECVTLDWNDNE